MLVFGIIGVLTFIFIGSPNEPTSSPALNPTANWQTFSIAHYTLKYPPQWTVVSENEEQVRISSPDSIVEPSNFPARGGVFHVTINTSVAPETQDDFIKRRQTTNIAERTSHQKITYNNEKAITFTETYSYLEPATTQITAILTPTATYEIFLITYDEAETEKPTLNQILSTFKFTQ